MTPFKEKNKEQYYKQNGKWIPAMEQHIMSLWMVWVEHEKAIKYQDEEGFTVFDYK